MNKHRTRGAKVRWNVRRDYGVKNKPRLSGGTLSAWTGRPGVVAGDCCHSKRVVQKRWKQTCLELTLCYHEFLPHRVRLRV